MTTGNLIDTTIQTFNDAERTGMPGLLVHVGYLLMLLLARDFPVLRSLALYVVSIAVPAITGVERSVGRINIVWN